MPDKIMLIGGAGFIGLHVLKKFWTEGYRDLSILDDHRIQGRDGYVDSLRGLQIADAGCSKVFQENLAHPETAEIIEKEQPRLVIYLAGASTVEEASDPAAFHESNTALMNTLEACKEIKKPPRFVYISSSMVYGHFKREPVSEGHPLNPTNTYGVMKVTGEKLVAASGLDHVIVRPTAVYGPYDSNTRVIKRFCEAALLGKPLEVLGDDRLDFTHVWDTATGIFLAATVHTTHDKDPIYNISSGKAISILEAAQTIAECAPRETVVAHHEQDVDTSRPRRGTLDIGKATIALGYSPQADFKVQVSRYMNQHLAPKWERAVVREPKYYVYPKDERKSA